jgi:hypothetical protein
LPYRFHAAHRFHASYILHLVFGCFALMFGGALYLQETSASMSAFGRDVIFVIGLVLLPGRWYAQRVAAHDFQRGYVVGGAVWAAANLLGWVSLTHHLRSASSSVGTLSLELTVGWAIAHVFFSTVVAAWPAPRVCTAICTAIPVVATVLHPQYTPLPAQRTVFCCALLLGWLVAQAVDRSVSHAYAMKFELEREREQQRLARRDRAAEARLNHLIKGKCGGASMLLEALRSRLGSDSPLGRELELPIGMLVMAGDWCT